MTNLKSNDVRAIPGIRVIEDCDAEMMVGGSFRVGFGDGTEPFNVPFGLAAAGIKDVPRLSIVNTSSDKGDPNSPDHSFQVIYTSEFPSNGNLSVDPETIVGTEYVTFNNGVTRLKEFQSKGAVATQIVQGITRN